MTERDKAVNNANNKNSEATLEAAERRAAGAAQALDARLSGPLAPLEKSLDDAFGEKASYQLPKEFKELLVKLAPWFAIIGGVLGLVSAYQLWRAAHYVNEWVDSVNRITEGLGVRVPGQTPTLGVMFWLSIATIVIVAILSLLAFPGLKERKKVGWNLMFYALLVNIAHSIATLFYDGDRFGSFIMTVLVSLAGLYILFQLRAHYVAAPARVAPAATKK